MRSVRLIIALALGAVVAACGSLPRRDAVPAAATSDAIVFGIPDARYYLDPSGLQALAREAEASVHREAAADPRSMQKPLSVLALSGGGDNGAFGAGVLVGWTAHGDRPNFKLVTGVSTGALIAPFAFLGSDYDPVLRDIYTKIDAHDVFEKRSLLAVVADDAFADSAPLARTIAGHLTDEVIRQIAAEYRRGRLLLIATTNLDVGRPVIWNLGAIAASSHPRTRELMTKILLASSSVPGLFPPVLFDAVADGRSYQEMHVDGGTVAQTFLYPPGLRSRHKRERAIRAYIIRNGFLGVPWQQVPRDTIHVAGRAVSTLIAANGVDDLYRIANIAKRDGIDFNLAYIRSDFDKPDTDPFDRVYMNALFDYGFEQARRGYRWEKAPPAISVAASPR
ncbi:MAG: patatin-like phospholipase family protein [Pseudolabrys sp.]